MKNKHKLSIRNLDLEHRLGVHGKYTSPHKLVAFCFAASITLGLALGFSFLPESVHSETPLGILTRRGLIPYFTLLGFNWGVMLLWMKARKVGTQKKAISFLHSEDFSSHGFNADNARDWMHWLNQSVDDPHAFILINRLHSAFASLHALRNPSALPGVVSSHAEADEIQSDESYSFPSMLLFLIPILGFIGTVVGLSQSIGGFGEALAQESDDIGNLIGSLQNVTGGLAVAFDTTLFALICALLLQLYLSIVRSRETSFLEDCTAFMQRNFFPNLIHPSQNNSSVEEETGDESE